MSDGPRAVPPCPHDIAHVFGVRHAWRVLHGNAEALDFLDEEPTVKQLTDRNRRARQRSEAEGPDVPVPVGVYMRAYVQWCVVSNAARLMVAFGMPYSQLRELRALYVQCGYSYDRAHNLIRTTAGACLLNAELQEAQNG